MSKLDLFAVIISAISLAFISFMGGRAYQARTIRHELAELNQTLERNRVGLAEAEKILEANNAKLKKILRPTDWKAIENAIDEAADQTDKALPGPTITSDGVPELVAPLPDLHFTFSDGRYTDDITITHDGKVIVREGLELDEATKLFWKSLTDHFPEFKRSICHE